MARWSPLLLLQLFTRAAGCCTGDCTYDQAVASACSLITGDLVISGTGYSSLSGLSGLTQVDGTLSIVGNLALTSLAGLGDLTQVVGPLLVVGNALTSFTGLGSLETVGGLTIVGNDALANVNALGASLTQISGDLYVAHNSQLVPHNSLCGGVTVTVTGTSSVDVCAFVPMTNGEFVTAVDAWIAPGGGPASGYSAIGLWTTSRVTNMADVFKGPFDDSQSWGCCETSLGCTPECGDSFNNDINGWDTSSVTTMSRMFKGATIFDRSLAAWNVASVTSMKSMFQLAFAFDSDLTAWDPSAVTTVGATDPSDPDDPNFGEGMFAGNSWTGGTVGVNSPAFNSDINSWDVPLEPRTWDPSARRLSITFGRRWRR
jgi:surface protein